MSSQPPAAGSGPSGSNPTPTGVGSGAATASSATKPSSSTPAVGASAGTSTTGTAAAAGTTTTTLASTTAPVVSLTTDQAVLDYLRRKGLGSAALELQSILEKEKKSSTSKSGSGSNKKGSNKNETTTISTDADMVDASERTDGGEKKKQDAEGGSGSSSNKEKSSRGIDEEEASSRNQRSLLTKSTGGGYGYDRDAAWPIVQWGLPDTGRRPRTSEETGGLSATTSGGAANTVATAITADMGVEEARAYLDAFCSLQLWVLSLPDEDGRQQAIQNPIARAQQLLRESSKRNGGGAPDVSLQQLIDELIAKQPSLLLSQAAGGGMCNNKDQFTDYNLPPSAKSELLAVTFALLVHTYCELLEVGMETTAHILRDAFRPVYESLYHEEYRDLYHCTTIDDVMRLNQHNSQHMESLSNLKGILVQCASYQLRREELLVQDVVGGGSSGGSGGGGAVLMLDATQRAMRDQKIQEYDRNIAILKQKYEELGQKASAAFEKMHDLPFLRRARAVRWQLTLSSTTYGMLAAFLNSKNESLLVMSTLLQVKCEIRVENRDPLPFTPSCVFDESHLGGVSMGDIENNSTAIEGGSRSEKNGLKSLVSPSSSLDINRYEIQWAAPSVSLKVDINEKVPFPKYHLDEEYDNEDQVKRDKQIVEFNRAMLVNGFRRLEALERKRDYESLAPSTKKRLKKGEQPLSTIANPLEPSILLTTLCASSSSSGPVLRSSKISSSSAGGGASGGGANNASSSSASDRTNNNADNISNIWEEAGIGLCCARLSPPDGRRVAVGCDDSAIRIWDVMDFSRQAEPGAVLLGHKNGFPVFDVDWNRDGRTLLSCGGDGSVRLWDTMAVGPFGETASITPSKVGPNKPPPPVTADSTDDPKAYIGMNTPGMRSEQSKYSSGAALAVYRGHVPSTPVWAVKFAPCGYYFCSAGADATARLWTTDRPVPVRLLTGHTSSNVNCVEWHPNCNYVITGGDDKTVRLWDIQTGRTVRLLDGCSSGVNVVQISPSGRYAAGADYSGVVHLWDLGMGKKLSELRTPQLASSVGGANRHSKTIHRLAFSACGTSLAAGGDDCCVRIWDVRSESLAQRKVTDVPTKSFATRQTMILDLAYTKRNLLLSMGKFVTPVPLGKSSSRS